MSEVAYKKSKQDCAGRPPAVPDAYWVQRYFSNRSRLTKLHSEISKPDFERTFTKTTILQYRDTLPGWESNGALAALKAASIGTGEIYMTPYGIVFEGELYSFETLSPIAEGEGQIPNNSNSTIVFEGARAD